MDWKILFWANTFRDWCTNQNISMVFKPNFWSIELSLLFCTISPFLLNASFHSSFRNLFIVIKRYSVPLSLSTLIIQNTRRDRYIPITMQEDGNRRLIVLLKIAPNLFLRWYSTFSPLHFPPPHFVPHKTFLPFYCSPSHLFISSFPESSSYSFTFLNLISFEILIPSFSWSPFLINSFTLSQ